MVNVSSLCQCGIYRGINVVYSVSVPCVQCHYCVAFRVCAICTWVLKYCRLCQCSTHRVIALQSMSVRHIEGIYFSAICVIAVCTRSLMYRILC